MGIAGALVGALAFLAGSSAAQDFAPPPEARGRSIIPEVRAMEAPDPLDPEIAYPPAKPEIHARGEWMAAQWGCRHLSVSEVADDDIDTDTTTRMRLAVHHTEGFVTRPELRMTPPQARAMVKTLLCSIRNYHMSDNNKDGEAWSDIGYHYLVDWEGGVWQGRKEEKVGANVRNVNNGTIGISLLGDFERQRPTAAQLRALKRLAAYLVYQHKISPLAIHGHHEWGNTSCPGRNLERKGEYLQPYREAAASPLRRIRMKLVSLWALMRRDGLVPDELWGIGESPRDTLPGGKAPGPAPLRPAPPDGTATRPKLPKSLALPQSLIAPSFDGR